MRLLLLLSFGLLFVSSSAFAGLTPDRETMYSCKYLDDKSQVEGAMIYKSRFGRGEVFYEIEVLTELDGRESSFFKRVNLVSIYDGAIEHFTTGNFRIKIDRVSADENGHMRAFGRIPQYQIHSKNWVCKDY